jgi:uncharacterized protein YndB with AHSA1/START domain
MAMTTTAPNTTTGELVLEITRVFNAPRELVFKAWTDPEHMARWGGPEGYSATTVELDARPGGAWRLGMRSPEGEEHLQGGVIREIVPPERLVYTFAWEEADGTPGHETLVSVTLAEHGPDAAQTLMTFRQGTFENVDSRDGHLVGWDSAFNVLAEYLENETAAPELKG